MGRARRDRSQLGWIRHCQLVQVARDAIELRVVPGTPSVAGGRRAHGVGGACRARGRATFAVRLVATIEREASGKTRPFVALGTSASHETTAPGVERTWQSPTQPSERWRRT